MPARSVHESRLRSATIERGSPQEVPMSIRSLLLGGAVMLIATVAADAGSRNHDTELVARLGAKQILIQTNAGANIFNTSNQQVTGSSSISVPAAQTGFIVATFTSESNCQGTPSGFCNIIINCDGVQLQPAVGTDFAFDSVGTTSSGANFHSLSVVRRTNVFTGGTHSCEVRENLVNGATFFRLDDWIFQFEFWRQL
jgi:hypothetical protein